MEGESTCWKLDEQNHGRQLRALLTSCAPAARVLFNVRRLCICGREHTRLHDGKKGADEIRAMIQGEKDPPALGHLQCMSLELQFRRRSD